MSSTPTAPEPLPTATSPPTPTRPRRRRLRRVVLGSALALAAVVGFGLYVMYSRQWEIEAAIAEADRLDRGWRFADIEAAREPVADGENSATLVKAASGLLPTKWGSAVLPSGVALDKRLVDLCSTDPVDAAELKALRAERAKAAAAVDKARELADRPRGRFAVAWSADLVTAPLPNIALAGQVSQLLVLDALVCSRDGEAAGALWSCRAALNAARSVGDEPTAFSQRMRVVRGLDAVHALERTLAAGTADAKSLEEMQALLADEGTQPFFLRAMRDVRVSYFQSLETMRTRKFNRASLGLPSSWLGPFGDSLVDQMRAGQSEAPYLRWTNSLVEAAKRPTEELDEALEALPEPKVQLPAILAMLRRVTEMRDVARTFNRAHAELRCAAAALAAERYRLAEHRWPERLDDLVPKYLAVVPADPFDGRPLRWRRLDDGIVVYSVGPDRADDGGKLDRKHPFEPGTDLGFQLWDVRAADKPPRVK